jgi:hypothetical protein
LIAIKKTIFIATFLTENAILNLARRSSNCARLRQKRLNKRA